MTPRLLLVLFLSALALPPAHAADRDAEAKQLMDALGISASLEARHQRTIKSVEAEVNELFADFHSANPNLDDQAWKEIDDEARKYAQRVANAWSAAEASRVYADALIAGAPNEGMQGIIAYYRTDEGQRALKMIDAANTKMSVYIAQRVRDESRAGLKDFYAAMRATMERHKQRRHNAPADTGGAPAKVQ